MVQTGILAYLLIFIALPALILVTLVALSSFNLYAVLIAASLFGIGVVMGPAFLQGEVR